MVWRRDAPESIARFDSPRYGGAFWTRRLSEQLLRSAAVLHGARALTRVARLPRPHDARKPKRRPLAAASIRIGAAAVRSETLSESPKTSPPPWAPHGVRAATGSSAVQLAPRTRGTHVAATFELLDSRQLGSGFPAAAWAKDSGATVCSGGPGPPADRARPPRGRSRLGAPCGVSGRRVACLVVGRRAARLGRAAERERPRQAQRARQRAPCCRA